MFALLMLITVILAITLSIYNRFYALLFLVPLSVYAQSSTVIAVGGRDINLGMDTIYIFIIVLIEIARGQNSTLKNSFSKTQVSLLLCFSYFFLNALISSIFGIAGFTPSGILVFIRLFQYVPIFIILCNSSINFDKTFLMIKVTIYTGISTALISIYQLMSGNFTHMKGMPSFTMPLFRESQPELIGGNYVGSANYNVFAAYLVIPIFFTVLLWYCRNTIQWVKKTTLLLILVTLIVGVFISSSRAGLLGVVFGVISMSFNYKHILPSIGRLAIILVFIFITGYFFREEPYIKNFTDVVFQFDEILPYAMQSITYSSAEMDFSSQALGAVIRLYSYSEAIRVFMLYPIFGCGFDQFLTQSTNVPENLFLQILAETGFVGFILYISFIVRIYKDAIRLPSITIFNKYYILIFQACILGLMLINLTGATFLIQKVWGPFLIMAGFFFGYKNTFLSKSTINNGN